MTPENTNYLSLVRSFPEQKRSEWWCELNCHRIPKDFPVKDLTKEQAWILISHAIPYSIAIKTWRKIHENKLGVPDLK